jgi:hypothetical protein
MSGIAGESVLAAERTARCHSVKSDDQLQTATLEGRTQRRSRSRRRAESDSGNASLRPRPLKTGLARYASARAVKRPLSRYACKSLRIDRRTYKATIRIDILTALPNP